MGTLGFYRIIAAPQKVGLSNIMLHRCSQVRLEVLGSGGVVTVKDPVSIHLKDINRGGGLLHSISFSSFRLVQKAVSWITSAANSRSKLVLVTSGLVNLTSSWVMSAGNLTIQV